MSTTKYHAAKISPSGGDVAAGDRRGAFPMWRPCRGSPSRAKLVPGLHIKGLSNKSPDRCRRRGFTVLPPTGGIINSLPQSGNPQPSGPKAPSNLRTLRTLGSAGAVNLFPHNPSTQPAAKPRPFSSKSAASAATTTLGLKGRQTYEPSGLRAGQS